MNLRDLIAGKRSDGEAPERVTFPGYDVDGQTLPEALAATDDTPADPRVQAALAAVMAQVAAEQADPLTVPGPWGAADFHTDVSELPLFRDTVRTELVRREDARGNRLTDGTWQARYARTWHERVQVFPVPPLPDYGLHRYDGLVDDIVADAGRRAAEREAEEARRALEAAAQAPDYVPLHAGVEAS